MFDDIGERIDHAGNEHLIVLQRHFCKATKLMRVARTRKWQNQSADLRLPYDRQYLLKGHVTIVRRFVNCPNRCGAAHD